MTPRIRYEPDDVQGLSLLAQADVVVVGGGSAGCAAAVASARSGARTLLIEAGGFLGGTGARVLDTFYGFYAPGPEAPRVVGGIGWEVRDRLFSLGQAFERPNTYGAGTGVTYEPEYLKLTWDEMVGCAGATLLLHALVTAVIAEDSTIVGLVVETKNGPARVDAGVIIDATGDAEVTWRAGGEIERTDLAGTQPATATFRVGGVGDDAASTAELRRIMREASASGRYDLPRVEGSAHVTMLDGVRHTNLTRVAGLDLTDPWQLTAAEVAGRRQVQEYLRLLRNEVPGYERAYLVSVSTPIGIRETRRIRGEYVLTVDDVLHARDFPDAIARCGAPVEDHADGSQTRWAYIGDTNGPTGATYGIPYRSLVPIKVDGLLVAGRCLSATHDAHASVRSMGQCMAMGHAAGLAAAIAVECGDRPRDIDVRLLRGRLVEQGAIL